MADRRASNSTSRTIHRVDDPSALARCAADALVSLSVDAIKQRGRFTVVLSGGSTPRELYQLLSGPNYRQKVDWSRVEFFWGDERTVPPSDDESNYGMAMDSLLQPLNVAPSQIHRIEAERDDLKSAADDYAREIARCFQVDWKGSPPRFDLVLLGIGTDGHTASLFPDTQALKVNDRWVVANEVPQLATRRITMTFPLINRARAVFFLVAGNAKAAVLAKALDEPKASRPFPCEQVSPERGRLDWFVDQDAAADLDVAPSRRTQGESSPKV